ncbi:ImmA/IrrE family metallo-endopeptidase [bacterium]|nr:ImmA/IrrE family metallo-endopeptidase [bacterium]
MRKANDSSLDFNDYIIVRKEAERLLYDSDAVGRFPTPVSDIMTTARVVVAPENVLDESFLKQIRRKAGRALKRALTKVLGLFDAKGRLIYIDHSVHKNKKPFLKLHETGHAVLPWQSDAYCFIEDCKQTLSPEISEQFDKEANVFATEVLFQLDGFTKEAADHPLEIKSPLRLSKKYGTSVYSTIRRYVSTHQRNCVVLVLNPPEYVPREGYKAQLRRVVSSESFTRLFGPMEWPDVFTHFDSIGALIPLEGRRMSSPRSLVLTDRNGMRWECVAEGFTQGYQVFILIYTKSALSRVIVQTKYPPHW